MTLIILLSLINPLRCYSQSTLIEANNEFSLKIFKAIKSDSSNLFISPFSLHMALAVVNEGARESTRDELNQLLSIRTEDNNAEHYQNLIERTINLNDPDFTDCQKWGVDPQSSKESNLLYVANSAWLNKKYKLLESYKQNIDKYYKAQLFEFSDENLTETNQKMNEWISDQTHKKISDAGKLKPETVMRIVNAIYFNSVWETPFDPDKTEKKTFFKINKEKVKLDLMKNQSHFRYYEDKTMQALFLPYLCEQFTMLVLLPQERYGIKSIEDNLSVQVLNNVRESAFRHEVIVSFPKFRVETELSPVNTIKRMGGVNMFSDNADFSGISARPVKISDIIHKTTIEVSEKNTEAAAVSIVEVVVTGYGGGNAAPPPPPKIFNANHPFLFFILDNRTNAILFIGRYVTD